jgi:hypothetical protein
MGKVLASSFSSCEISLSIHMLDNFKVCLQNCQAYG